MEEIKIILKWITVLLTIASLTANVYLSGVVWMDRQMMAEQAEYIKYKDSTQLVIMDKLVQKYYGPQK